MKIARRAFLAAQTTSVAPAAEIVNLLEMEQIARRKLDSMTFARVAGGDRSAFERMTFRPRMMVNTMELDLSLNLFGVPQFAPILAGPLAELGRYHPEAELAVARGAAAAKAAVILSARSTVPLDRVVPAATSGFFFQAFPDTPSGQVAKAVELGAKAVFLTLGGASGWDGLAAVRKAAAVPVVVKGIMNARDARAALDQGAAGIVVSSYREPEIPGMAAPIEALPAVVQAVGGRVPVLIDGGFRRGTDVMKALALGARAVLLARPVVWGLAAHGAQGVQTVLELMQSDLARTMAMCGRRNLAGIDGSVLRHHRW